MHVQRYLCIYDPHEIKFMYLCMCLMLNVVVVSAIANDLSLLLSW